jgi:hypothetical protein
MPFSYAQYNGDGSTRQFSVPFPFILRAHVKVFTGYDLAAGTGTELVDGIGFSWLSDTLVETAVAPALGQSLTVIRRTPSLDRLVVWQAGSPPTPRELNLADRQSFYLTQEQADFAQIGIDTAQQSLAAANAALAAISASVVYMPIAAVVNAPIFPSLNQRIEILNSTGIEADSRFIGVPGGFIGNAQLSVRAIWNGSKWQWVSYGVPDPDGRYLPKSGGAMTGQIDFVSGQGGLNRPNLLLNDVFKVNQRGYVSGTATTSFGQYTLDRWKVITSGQNLSWSASGGIRTVNVPAGGIEQVVEAGNMPAGTYIIDWDGDAGCFINGTQRFKNVPFSHPGNVDVQVGFFNNTLSRPKLERGSFSTPWFPRSIAEDLSLCQRYFWRTSASPALSFGSHVSGVVQTFRVQFPVTMRAAPVLASDFTGATLANISTVAWNNPSVDGARIVLTSNAVAAVCAFAFGSGNFISASAEL